uniref:Uncharacterized protein n=1 Tax=Arundo donax TaxID=35708 RepID=A0A0A9GQW3_ARUDO
MRRSSPGQTRCPGSQRRGRKVQKCG